MHLMHWVFHRISDYTEIWTPELHILAGSVADYYNPVCLATNPLVIIVEL